MTRPDPTEDEARAQLGRLTHELRELVVRLHGCRAQLQGFDDCPDRQAVALAAGARKALQLGAHALELLARRLEALGAEDGGRAS